MRLCDLLKIENGVTAVIGSGGKTTLLHALAEELDGKIILCTTTLMYPSKTCRNAISVSEDEIEQMLREQRIICVGEHAERGKIKQSRIPIETLVKLADYVLVEADGAKQMPLKAHLAHEPVIPKIANQTICVVGAMGFGMPIYDAVHRPEKFAELAETALQDLATPERVGKVLSTEGLADRVFVNQVETGQALENAKRLAQNFDWPVVAGSLKNKKYYKIKTR